ncbi:hypothetical protein BCR32DRAFT_263797 [Anaeromyces robustus]|uniref:Uncharacterized protein n=1 Tax=Anaeromyces robustus TaxID=1754192 RepID=A0A1Y1XS41_9FUNG|nr:hypothetical protein BCR32DRAFT_263797 [Anaeromyces robustus]|eukprot:ORX88124.1 hypothetical protein BCR32DRAFT_263797 [Anaeromyces robustus]
MSQIKNNNNNNYKDEKDLHNIRDKRNNSNNYTKHQYSIINNNCNNNNNDSNNNEISKYPNNRYPKFLYKSNNNNNNNVDNKNILCSSPKSICTESTLVSISSNNSNGNQTIEIKELSKVITYILFKILNSSNLSLYENHNPIKQNNFINNDSYNNNNDNNQFTNTIDNKESNNICISIQKDTENNYNCNNYNCNNIIYNNIQSQKIISLSSLGPINSKLYENNKVNIRKIQINNNYEVNINEINIIKDTTLSNNSYNNFNNKTISDINDTSIRLSPTFTENSCKHEIKDDITPRFNIEYSGDYCNNNDNDNKSDELLDTNLLKDVSKDKNNIKNDNSITATTNENSNISEYENVNNYNINENENENVNVNENEIKILNVISSDPKISTPNMNISYIDSNGKGDDFSDANSNISLLNSSIKSSSSTLLNFNANYCCSTSNSDIAFINNSTNNNLNRKIYRANSQISYPSSSNSFSETEFNSSIASSALFSNTSPYSQILPSPSYFSVASASTNASQCSYLSNPSLTFIGNNILTNTKSNYENRILSMKKNFNQVQKQVEHILMKTCNKQKMNKDKVKRNNNEEENNSNNNNNNNNSNNNSVKSIKKISYASIVKGNNKNTSENKVYSNLVNKRSVEHIKSSYGSNKDKTLRSVKNKKMNGKNMSQNELENNESTKLYSISPSKSPYKSSESIISDADSLQLLENEYKQFLIAYIISIKLLDDNNWKNSSWSKSTEISLQLINLWESLFLKSLNYNLYISNAEYNKWYKDFEEYRKESRDFIMLISNNNYWLNINNNFNALNIKSYNYSAIKDYYYYYFNDDVNNNNSINNANPFIYSESPRNELSTFVKNPYSFPVSVNYLGPSNSYDNLLTFKNNYLIENEKIKKINKIK